MKSESPTNLTRFMLRILPLALFLVFGAIIVLIYFKDTSKLTRLELVVDLFLLFAIIFPVTYFWFFKPLSIKFIKTQEKQFVKDTDLGFDLVTVLMASILVGELVAMLLVHFFKFNSLLIEAFVDAIILVFLIFPTIYLLVFLPFQKQIKLRNVALDEKDESELKFHQVFLTSPDAMNINSLDTGNFTLINEGFTKMMGYTLEDVKGKTPIDLAIWVNPDIRLILLSELKEHGIIQNFEAQLKTKTGKLLDCLVSSSLIEIEGKQHIITISKDISKRKNAERALKKALEKAEESDRLKTSFLHNMSHEVRTPLNAIVGFSELMKEPQTTEKLALFSKLISRSSYQLMDIITDVIEISQIHEKQTSLNITNFDVVALLKQLKSNFIEKAEKSSIDLVFTNNIPFDAYVVQSDHHKIKKITSHLLDNAIKFSELGGKVELICELINGKIQITISDSGVGISKKMQEVIFATFRQVETDISKNLGGNGLGLPIVKAYTEMLNGTLKLSTKKGKGSTFMVTIPMHEVSKIKEIPKNTTEKKSLKTILIAEDEYYNYLFLEELLSELNVTILHAADGKQAIDKCKLDKDNVIDLVLMDINMPIMDGYTATKLIKEFRPKLPIIAQTAYAMESEVHKLSEVFDGYVTKPINKNELKQKIGIHFEN